MITTNDTPLNERRVIMTNSPAKQNKQNTINLREIGDFLGPTPEATHEGAMAYELTIKAFEKMFNPLDIVECMLIRTGTNCWAEMKRLSEISIYMSDKITRILLNSHSEQAKYTRAQMEEAEQIGVWLRLYEQTEKLRSIIERKFQNTLAQLEEHKTGLGLRLRKMLIEGEYTVESQSVTPEQPSNPPSHE